MMSRKPTRVFAFAALTLLLSACQAWKVDHRPIETIVQADPGQVAVTMNDLRWVVLRAPSIHGDSVVGTRIAGNTYGQRRTALALSGVRTVERRRFSLIRTIGLGVAVAFIPSLYRLAIVEEE